MEKGLILELEGVDTYYGPIQVLYDIDIKVHKGELVCLLGGNASGKSTTLKTILGVFKVKKGAVKLNGEKIIAYKTAVLKEIAGKISCFRFSRTFYDRHTITRYDTD